MAEPYVSTRGKASVVVTATADTPADAVAMANAIVPNAKMVLRLHGYE